MVDYGPDTIAVGDVIQVGSPGWHQVVKVNHKTAAVPSGHSWTHKVEYHRITGRPSTAARARVPPISVTRGRSAGSGCE